LPTGTFRVWIRSIDADGNTGPWSIPVTFTIVSNRTEATPIAPQAMLASIDSSLLDAEDFTTSMIPTVVAADTGRQVPPTQHNFATVVTTARKVTPEQSETVAPATDTPVSQELESADELMTQWDDEIWAEESQTGQATTIAAEPASPESTKSAASGWLSALSLVPAAMKRNRRKDE